VVPGNSQVPVIIEGIDASYGVVFGDWGLYRPGHVTPYVAAPPYPQLAHPRWGYYPATGRRPRYGRHEINRPGRQAPPAETYYRTWSTPPDRRPTIAYPPYDPPPVITAPGSQD
jgi:hypothetical protein